MARLHRLQMDLQPQLAHFPGHVLDCGLRLRGSHGPRADVLGDVGHLPVGVVVGQSGIANRRELLNQLRRQWSGSHRLGTLVVGVNPDSWLLGKENTRGQDW